MPKGTFGQNTTAPLCAAFFLAAPLRVESSVFNFLRAIRKTVPACHLDSTPRFFTCAEERAPFGLFFIASGRVTGLDLHNVNDDERRRACEGYLSVGASAGPHAGFLECTVLLDAKNLDDAPCCRDSRWFLVGAQHAAKVSPGPGREAFWPPQRCSEYGSERS